MHGHLRVGEWSRMSFFRMYLWWLQPSRCTTHSRMWKLKRASSITFILKRQPDISDLCTLPRFWVIMSVIPVKRIVVLKVSAKPWKQTVIFWVPVNHLKETVILLASMNPLKGQRFCVSGHSETDIDFVSVDPLRGTVILCQWILWKGQWFHVRELSERDSDFVGVSGLFKRVLCAHLFFRYKEMMSLQCGSVVSKLLKDFTLVRERVIPFCKHTVSQTDDLLLMFFIHREKGDERWHSDWFIARYTPKHPRLITVHLVRPFWTMHLAQLLRR